MPSLSLIISLLAVLLHSAVITSAPHSPLPPSLRARGLERALQRRQSTSSTIVFAQPSISKEQPPYQQRTTGELQQPQKAQQPQLPQQAWQENPRCPGTMVNNVFDMERGLMTLSWRMRPLTFGSDVKPDLASQACKMDLFFGQPWQFSAATVRWNGQAQLEEGTALGANLQLRVADNPSLPIKRYVWDMPGPYNDNFAWRADIQPEQTLWSPCATTVPPMEVSWNATVRAGDRDLNAAVLQDKNTGEQWHLSIEFNIRPCS